MAHTSAGKLASELKGFTASLRETKGQLDEEIGNIKKSREEIQKEFDTTAATFIQNTVPELTGEQFDIFADLAQKTPELTGKGLAFYRQELLGARETALAAVNKNLSETVDADSFQNVLGDARGKHENASTHIGAADDVTAEAKRKLGEWEKTPEYAFVALNEEISAKGKIPLSAKKESRDYYNPASFEVPVVGLFKAMLNSATRDAEYRKVRKALNDYGQGENGKDIFAEIAAHEKKTADLKKAVTDAEDAAKTVRAQFADVEQNYTRLSDLGKDIKTDGQILGLVREQAASYLTTPEFAMAAANQYGEDFPSGIQLLHAKLTTLATLEEGAQAKMEALDANIKQASKQYDKAKGLDSDTEVDVSLDAVKRQNAARKDAFDKYTKATRESWDRTTTYTPPPTTVYVNQRPDFLQSLILAEILLSNQQQEEHAHSHHDAQATPPILSPYSAVLLGVDKKAAKSLGVPDEVFDFAPVQTEGGKVIPDDAFDILTTSHTASALDHSLSQQISNAVKAEEDAAAEASRRASASFNNSTKSDDTFSFGGNKTETFDIGGSSSSSPSAPEKFDI